MAEKPSPFVSWNSEPVSPEVISVAEKPSPLVSCKSEPVSPEKITVVEKPSPLVSCNSEPVSPEVITVAEKPSPLVSCKSEPVSPEVITVAEKPSPLVSCKSEPVSPEVITVVEKPSPLVSCKSEPVSPEMITVAEKLSESKGEETREGVERREGEETREVVHSPQRDTPASKAVLAVGTSSTTEDDHRPSPDSSVALIRRTSNLAGGDRGVWQERPQAGPGQIQICMYSILYAVGIALFPGSSPAFVEKSWRGAWKQGYVVGRCQHAW